MKKALLVAMLFVPIMLAADDNQDEMVTVPKKYVSSEGMNHQGSESNVSKAAEWAGIGKEVGIATKEALNAVVDTSEKFGSTKVGTFVMIMVAWKIMAKDILAIIIGIPIWVVGLCIWIWAAKKFFFGYKVLDKQEGKTKFYSQHEPYNFNSEDARSATGIILTLIIVVWFIVGIAGIA